MKKTIKIAAFLIVLATIATMLLACQTGPKEIDMTKDTYYVEVNVKSFGKFKLELYRNIAPITVENFLNLVNSGYYNGLTFNRMQEGFVLQGGEGKSVSTIKGEFAINGVENNIKHEKGVISMARSMGNDTASSQFFIMLGAASFLDGSYAAFGKVIEGYDVVEKICDSIPSEAFKEQNYCFLWEKYQPVIKSMTIVDN